MSLISLFFFFKQKTAYDMRISDWSSDGALPISEQVRIHTLFAGGSFGRRATPNADMVSEAVGIAKAIGGRAPVKLVWTREDDIQGGRYRPMYFHRLRAGLDAAGRDRKSTSMKSRH